MPRNDLIQVRSDTSSNWTSVNPILATGEIGFESNTGKFKIGTGSTAWSSLPYTSDTAGSATTAGTVTTAAQPAITSAVNLTSVGTLSALDVTGAFEVSPSVNHTLYVSGNRVGVRTNTPQGAFDVNGTAFATIFSGSGADLTSIPAGQLTGTVANLRLNSSYTNIVSITASGTVTADLFSGSGASLTSIPNSATTADSANTASAIVSRNSSGNFSAGTITASLSGTAASVPASGITGQTGMWVSANRPGPYRLYRNDNDSDYNVQTYYTGSKWRLYGYNGDTAHADTHVGYADRADTADSWTTARTISLTGDVTGSDSISGSGNISINATIGSGKVTAAMIASNAVTASEIASGAITNSEVSGTAAIALSKLATTGTLQADYFVGNGFYVSGLNASALTSGTVPAARISSTINYSVNRLYTNDSIPIIANDAVTSSGSGYYATWVSVSTGSGTDYYLERYTSTRKDKENFQPLDNIITPNMIDDINISLWNRKTAPGIPEVGPIAEEMHEISPFLSACGMLINDDGTVTADEPGGINSGAWMSLLTIGMQDIRQRLAKLENPDV